MVADERDVIRLRTNYRKDPPEDVYLYRLHGPAENGRRLLREYLREINALKSKPEFYNTLTANCTGNIWLHSRVNPGAPAVLVEDPGERPRAGVPAPGGKARSARLVR